MFKQILWVIAAVVWAGLMLWIAGMYGDPNMWFPLVAAGGFLAWAFFDLWSAMRKK